MFADHGPHGSARSPSISSENRKRCIADLGFVCRASTVPSCWRSEFAGKPSGGPRVEGVRCNDVYFDVIALWAFKQPLFKSYRARRNALQHHPRLAARTVRALNGIQESLRCGHDASLRSGGSVTELSVTDGSRMTGGDAADHPTTQR